MTQSNKSTVPVSEQDTTVLYIRPVPSETKAFFKAECARNKVSMQDAIITFMEQCKTMLPQLKIKKQKVSRKNV